MSELPPLIVTIEYRGYDYEALLASMDEDTCHRFAAWFAGQTGPIYKGRCLVYEHDYLNFVKGGAPYD